MTARSNFLTQKFKGAARKARTIRCARTCAQQPSPLDIKSDLIVTTFYDVEGDYAMPGQSAASIMAVGRILEIESKYGIKSTYNVVARYALDAPEVMAEVQNAGHEIASHSYDHKILTRLKADEIRDNLHRTKETFQNLGIDIAGHRSPQSDWDYRVMHALTAEGYKWSAENGEEPYPYRLREENDSVLWRFAVTDDDWCYERDRLSPDESLERWRQVVVKSRGRKQHIAIGFHPWVEAVPGRLAAFEEFMHWLSEEDGVRTMPFGHIIRSIESNDSSLGAVRNAG